MKNSKVICFLASLLSMLGSPRVSYGDLKTGSISKKITDLTESTDKQLENKKSETKNSKIKTILKKKKMMLNRTLN